MQRYTGKDVQLWLFFLFNYRGPGERTETFFATNSGVMSGIKPLTNTRKTTNKN